MAKSSRLPDPEAYAKHLAERRKRQQAEKERVKSQMAAVSDWVAPPKQLLKIVESQIEEVQEARNDLLALHEQYIQLQNQLSAVAERMETALESLSALDEKAKVPSANQQQLVAIRANLQALVDRPETKIDLSGVEASINALIARPQPQIPDLTELQQPVQDMRLRVTERDENGDIEAVSVEVIH